MDERLDGYYGVNCMWQGGQLCAEIYFRGTMAELETVFLAPLRAALQMTDVQGTNAAGEMYEQPVREGGHLARAVPH